MELTATAALDAVNETAAKVREIRDAAMAEAKRIDADPRLSVAGKAQQTAQIRRDAADRVAPLVARAREIIADAEVRVSTWTLDEFLLREEFTATTDRAVLDRVHLAAVLPRASVRELRALMSSAARATEAWRVSMIRREALARLDAGVPVEATRRELGEVIAAAAAVEPPDIAEMRAARDELVRMRPFLEDLFRQISAPPRPSNPGALRPTRAGAAA